MDILEKEIQVSMVVWFFIKMQKQFDKERVVFSTIGAGTIGHHM